MLLWRQATASHCLTHSIFPSAFFPFPHLSEERALPADPLCRCQADSVGVVVMCSLNHSLKAGSLVGLVATTLACKYSCCMVPGRFPSQATAWLIWNKCQYPRDPVMGES